MATEELFRDILSPTSPQYDLNLIDDLFAQPNTINNEFSRTGKLLNQIKEFYDTNLFCDLKMVSGNIDVGFNSVACHSLVLVSSIPGLKQICQTAIESNTDDDFARIYLPEFSFQELKGFIDDVYKSMLNNADISVSSSLVQSFGLKPSKYSNMILVEKEVTSLPIAVQNDTVDKASLENQYEENGQSIPKNLQASEKSKSRRSKRKRKASANVCDDYDDQNNETDDLPFNDSDDEYLGTQSKDKAKDPNHEKPVKKRGRPSKVESQNLDKSELNEIGLRELSQKDAMAICDEQNSNFQNMLPFSWSLSDPSLFSDAIEYQKLLETFSDSGTVIHATTGPQFDFTKEVQSDWTNHYANKIRKLIRMPDTKIAAIVAIGIRNNINIVQPVAVSNWPISLVVENLLEMLLNITGTSKSKFFGHDRYYRFKKVSSKPNRVGRAMQAIKKLPEEDREVLRIETIKQMEDLEAVRNKFNFTHLPIIPVK